MIIAVDFDGTCVGHRFPEMGQDVPYATRVIKALVDRGHSIMLWTMRSHQGKYPNVLADAIHWFTKNKIPLIGINANPQQEKTKWSTSNKQYANYYIDDAAIGCPLMQMEGEERLVVDWLEVENLLINQGIL